MSARRLLLPAALSLLAAALPVAAQAQLAPGRSGSSSTSYMGHEEAMNDLVAFGRCYAKRFPDQAWSLIATRATSREEALTYRKLFRGENQTCLGPGTTLSAPLAYVRGAIAEGLLDAHGSAPVPHQLPVPAAAEVRNLSDAARCYVGGNKETVRALLATKVSSKNEYQAVSALMDGFGACLPAGVEIQFDSTVIRFRLAEALLRLAPEVAAASGN
jgi:hypothetical protein